MIYLIFLCELSVFAVLSFSLCNILYSFPDFLSSKFINLLLNFIRVHQRLIHTIFSSFEETRIHRTCKKCARLQIGVYVISGNGRNKMYDLLYLAVILIICLIGCVFWFLYRAMKSTADKHRRVDDTLDKSIEQQERKDAILANDELIQQRQEKLIKKMEDNCERVEKLLDRFESR